MWHADDTSLSQTWGHIGLIVSGVDFMEECEKALKFNILTAGTPNFCLPKLQIIDVIKYISV